MTDTAHKFELVPEPIEEPTPDAPARMLWRLLRGRLRLTAILAMTLALVFAVAGYFSRSPVYQSRGLVLIEGALSPIIYDSQELQLPPMFEAYIAQQMAFVKNGSVLREAIARPEMREAGWPEGPEGVDALSRALSVDRGRREQVLRVSVRHADPEAARIAVDSVLTSFEAMAMGPPGLSVTAKESALDAREEELTEEFARIREEMLVISDHYDYDGLSRRHTKKVEELMTLDRKLEELRFVRSRLAEGGTDLEMAEMSTMLTPAPQQALARLEDRRRAVLAKIDTYRDQYQPNAPFMRELHRQLDEISTETALLNGTAETATSGPALETASSERLDILEAEYAAMREQVRADVERLGMQRVRLTELDGRASVISSRLAHTRQRLEEIRVEGAHQNLNRVSISSWGDHPVSPTSNRRKAMTAAGFMFGSGTGVAIVLLIGLIDRRLRYVDDIESQKGLPPVVALLPTLSRYDEQAREHAGRSVHQLRNLLMLQCGSPLVCAMTSAQRGDGRTSLAIGLARSFAQSGARTLILDADVGYPELSRKLSVDGQPGLLDALETGQVPAHATGQDHLSAMPVGHNHRRGAAQLSRDKIEKLLTALRGRFDIVIVDTGPILDSVEALLMAAASDHVLVTVDRDQRVDRLRTSLSRLEQAGATCGGLVFNRAHPSDLDRRVDGPEVQRTTGHNMSLMPDQDDGSVTITIDPPLKAPGATGRRRRVA